MKLYIPTIGDVIKLAKPWTFDLWVEDRNITLLEYFRPHPFDNYNATWKEAIHKNKWRRMGIGDCYPSGIPDDFPKLPFKSMPVILQAGIELVFDRLYLAKVNRMYTNADGSAVDTSEYHSITFIIRKGNEVLKNRKQIRFWVKLADANNIEF